MADLIEQFVGFSQILSCAMQFLAFVLRSLNAFQNHVLTNRARSVVE